MTKRRSGSCRDLCWQPILDGSDRSAALDAAYHVADALRDIVFAARASGQGIGVPADGDLAGREAGIAICLAYLSLCTREAAHRDAALEALRLVEERTATTPSPPTLFTGFVGVAWAAVDVHRRRSAQDCLDEDWFADVDDTLLQYLDNGARAIPCELVSGAAGIGMYALSRPSQRPRECVAAVLTMLRATSHRTDVGTAWPASRVDYDPDHELRKDVPCYHLGMAHGLAGVVAFLASAVEANVCRAEATDLLNECVAFLLAHRRASAHGAFARTVNLGSDWGRYDSSWCWGDAGIASAVMLAARAASRSDWADVAVETARALARRSPEDLALHDSCLCHGSAGIGHVFNRFYQWTGDEAFATAARHWLRTTLTHQQRHGVGGFQFRAIDPRTRLLIWHDDPGFLGGSAGVGAALAAAASEEEPTWDHPLFLATPTPTNPQTP